MGGFIELVNAALNPIIEMGAPVMMFLILTLLAKAFGVSWGKALEGGIKLAIALTGTGLIIGILTGAFSESLQAFVNHTGITLTIIDVGWAPLATITWGSPYTLFFLLVMLIVNIVMIFMKKTNTLDVDVFDIWHLSITGLLIMWYAEKNALPTPVALLIATIAVVLVGILKLINSDLMKPTFDDLLGTKTSPMTSTHMNYMMNPLILLLDRLCDRFFPALDKYDFDAAKLNQKIGFWGSKFAIGCMLGFVIGIMGDPRLTQESMKGWFALGFTAGACLELFSLIGSWFIAAVEPLSQGITDFANKKMGGRLFNIGLDWPFIAGRAEVWACANILAPIMLVEAVLLAKVGNGILPLAGIIAMGMTPALLVVTRGRLLRMILFGSLLLPLFLLSGTMIAPFATELAKNVGAFPKGAPVNAMITHSTLEGPMEKILGYMIGDATTGQLAAVLNLLIFLVLYLGLFAWYRKQMILRNQEYAKQEQ